MMTAAVAPLAGRNIQLLPKETREIKFIFEARLRGNFLDGEFAFGEQVASPEKSEFEQILVRAQAGMCRECMAKPTVTDTKFPCQKLHVQVARELVLDSGNGGFDGIGILCVTGRLRLLGGVGQAHQIVRRASKDLLECRAVRPNGLHYPAEGGKHGVLGMDFDDGIFCREQLVPKPTAGDFAIKADPVFVPAGFPVGRVAMPDFWKKKENMAGFNGCGQMESRFKCATAAGYIDERKSIKNAPVLPVKRETFWMTPWRIGRVRRDARFAGGGDVKSPIFIAAADGKIAIK